MKHLPDFCLHYLFVGFTGPADVQLDLHGSIVERRNSAPVYCQLDDPDRLADGDSGKRIGGKKQTLDRYDVRLTISNNRGNTFVNQVQTLAVRESF